LSPGSPPCRSAPAYAPSLFIVPTIFNGLILDAWSGSLSYALSRSSRIRRAYLNLRDIVGLEIVMLWLVG